MKRLYRQVQDIRYTVFGQLSNRLLNIERRRFTVRPAMRARRASSATGGEYIIHTNERAATAPRRILDLVTKFGSIAPRGAGDAVPSTDLSQYLAQGFTIGNRDNECYHLACSLWRKHFNDPDFVEAAIADCWRLTPDHDTFPWSQAQRKIAEAYKFINRSREAEFAFLRMHGGAA